MSGVGPRPAVSNIWGGCTLSRPSFLIAAGRLCYNPKRPGRTDVEEYRLNPGFLAWAFAAGILSFTSPCVLPLIPGYLSFISGFSYADLSDPGKVPLAKILWPVSLFVVGFAVVFTALGASASAAGAFLLTNQLIFNRIAGIFIVFMALVFMGIIKIPFLMAERRLDMQRLPGGPVAALPLGMAFAVGWTPCVGPVLSSVLVLAASESTVSQGAILLFTYSLGLGLPFVFTGVVFSKALKTIKWVQRHNRGFNLIAGSLLLVMGLLLIANRWTQFLSPFINLFTKAGWPPI